MPDVIRLNLGSGNSPIQGFVNVDVLADVPGVDVVADLNEPLPFEDGSVDMIYASHVLEHSPHGDVPRILAQWRRVLRDGGELLVAVPDLDVIARQLVARHGWFTPPHNPWLGAIYGGQKDAFDFHKGGFNAPWLAGLLANAGFGAVRQVPDFPDVGVPDTSRSFQPFGINVSLNMRAVAGAKAFDPALLQPSAPERLLATVDRGLAAAMRISTAANAYLGARRRRRLERALRRSSEGL